jgi:hypothetical protein
MKKIQISYIPVGGEFVTLLTNRSGEVLPGEPRDDCGVSVRLSNPTEEKTLHPEIRVMVN